MALTVFQIETLPARATAYRASDGGSLYVVVQPTGSKSYEFRYKRYGKVYSIIIGNIKHTGLAEARKERDRLRGVLADGLDPLNQRRLAMEDERARLQAVMQAAHTQRQVAVARREAARRDRLTLEVVGDQWIADSSKHWTVKHADQTRQSLRDHVYPHIGNIPIASIGTSDVLDVMDKLLAGGKVETARRVRQRLDAVFEFAGLTHKITNNPMAVAKRAIGNRVKAASKVNPGKSFPCVPVTEIPQLLLAMRAYVGTPVTRSLLWFVALTGCRTSEARYATWTEFDMENGVWTIPAARMKARRQHVVPLAPAVLALLTEIRKHTGAHCFVFPHPRRHDRPASENAILFALAAIGYKDRMTGHGFRHLFSTVANDSGSWRPDVIEAALAHKDADAIRATYNHATYWDERRRLMYWWADELLRLETGSPAKVVPLKQAAA